MTRPAGKPSGLAGEPSASTGEPSRPPDGERSPESASFELARVGGRRSRPPLAAIAVVVALGGIVAAGLGGRLGAGAFPLGGENQALVPSPDGSGGASGPPPSPIMPPNFPADTGAMLTSGPGDVVLHAKRNAGTVFVHADVYLTGVTWVFMSLRDDAGQVAGWASVSVPGAAGPAASGVPTLRFDVELAIPAAFDAHLWVQAHAYDARFGLMATARVDTPITAPTR